MEYGLVVAELNVESELVTIQKDASRIGVIIDDVAGQDVASRDGEPGLDVNPHSVRQRIELQDRVCGVLIPQAGACS